MIDFSLEGREYIPLCDLLKFLGLCENGGSAKIFISQGDVKVDGEIELRKRCKIRENQVVEFNGEKIRVLK